MAMALKLGSGNKDVFNAPATLERFIMGIWFLLVLWYGNVSWLM